mmetsp:Transcript_80432/g.239644  ORF Transcript_80432/g.239644 Transcript_80432/m.239644 type:complete len:427 (-) Transcript_80432:8-1288(-)
MPAGNEHLVPVEELAHGADVARVTLVHRRVAHLPASLRWPQILQRDRDAGDQGQWWEARPACKRWRHQKAQALLEPPLQHEDEPVWIQALWHEGLIPEAPHRKDVQTLFDSQAHKTLVLVNEADILPGGCVDAFLRSAREDCHVLTLAEDLCHEGLCALEGTQLGEHLVEAGDEAASGGGNGGTELHLPEPSLVQQGPGLRGLGKLSPRGGDATEAATGPGEAVENGADGKEAVGVHADDVVPVRPAAPLGGAEVAPLLREHNLRLAPEEAPRHPRPQPRTRGCEGEAAVIARAPGGTQRARQRPGGHGHVQDCKSQEGGNPGRGWGHAETHGPEKLPEPPSKHVHGAKETHVQESLARTLHIQRNEPSPVGQAPHGEVPPPDKHHRDRQQGRARIESYGGHHGQPNLGAALAGGKACAAALKPVA